MIPEDEDINAARMIFDQLDDSTRLCYAMYYAESHPVEHIARRSHTTVEFVRYCLEKAERELTDELHEKLVYFLTQSLKALRETENSLKTEAVRRYQEELSFAQMMAAHPGMPGIMENVGQAASDAAQMFPQYFGTGETAVATGLGVAATGKTLLSSALITLTLPFLWFMSMMLTGKAMGLALVREAPTLYAKRWLTKQLFLSFSGLIILPLIFFLIAFCLSEVFGKGSQYYLIGFFCAVFCGIVVGYIPWANTKYQKIKMNPKNLNLDFQRLAQLVHQGLGALAMASLGFFFIIATMFSQAIRTNINSGEWLNVLNITGITFGFGLLLFLYHFSGCYLFGELLMISQDNETSHSVTPSAFMVSMMKFWKDARNELTYMWPFIICTIGPNIIHLASYRTRPLIACFELAAVIPWWLLVLQHNMRVPQTRWKYTIPAFVIMLTVMFLLRFYIYHPLDM